MLPLLKERVNDQVPRAVAAAISTADLLDYDDNPRRSKEVDDRYQAATLRFLVSELDALSMSELKTLKTVFKDCFLHTLSGLELPVTHRLRSWVDLEDPRNVFEHELGHARPLPQEVRQRTIVEVTFMKERALVYPNGLCETPEDMPLKHRLKALCACAPDSLSDADVGIALWHASRTDDMGFVTAISQTAFGKPRHKAEDLFRS